MMPSIIQPSTSNSKIKQDSFSVKATKNITEVYASTKSYPPWWSDIEDSKVLRRRKSMGDTVLERNLCFVDTPGYSNGISRMERMQSILEYIELQLTKPFSAPTATEGDIAGLLSGSGGSQVDLVLYLITQGRQRSTVGLYLLILYRLEGRGHDFLTKAYHDYQRRSLDSKVRHNVLGGD